MNKKHYTLIMTYQYTNFEEEFEKTKTKDFNSDDLQELVNILNQYVNGFMLKEKKSHCWMYFHAHIQNNKLLSHDTEYSTYDVSLERRD